MRTLKAAKSAMVTAAVLLLAACSSSPAPAPSAGGGSPPPTQQAVAPPGPSYGPGTAEQFNQEVGAGQFEVSVRGWLVENDLGLGGVNDALAHQFHINEMEPHGSLVGSAHAPETKGISFSLSLGHILETLGRFPDLLDEGDLLVLLLGGQFLLL